MKKLIPLMILVALMGTLLGFLVVEVSAECGGEVKFRGVVNTDEEWSEIVCYGSYHCHVTVNEILYDPNGTLTLGANVSVAYGTQQYLQVGEKVECYGYYWKTCGPMQCVGHCECKGDSYYVKRFSPPVGGLYIPVNKLELLSPYIGLTILLVVAVITVGYAKKRKRDTEIISKQTIKEPVYACRVWVWLKS